MAAPKQKKSQHIVDGRYKPLDFREISVAIADDLGTIPAGTVMVAIQPQSQSVRYRDDGTAPTAAVGMLLPVNSILFYTGDFELIEFIETAATATLAVTFYGLP